MYSSSNAIRFGGAVALLCVAVACSSPAKLEIVPDTVVLEGHGASKKLEPRVLDADGKQITEGADVVWFTEDQKNVKLSHDGEVTAVASGEAVVEAEVVGTEIKAEVKVRVKIPGSINLSHERLRLWTGQVKENVWAEVHSEKGAFIEGYKPEWSSEDPEIVKVEPIVDEKRRQSWVKMTGLKSGTTYIFANFQHLSKKIRVAVFDEDEEVALDGTRIPKDKDKKADEKKK